MAITGKAGAAIVAIGCAALTAGALWKHFWLLQGDASVYWVFARSMWTDGFFHFGAGPVSHGATSPGWAVILSLASAPGLGDPIIAWKLVSLLAWVLLIVLTFSLGRTVTRSTTQATMATILVMLHPAMRDSALRTYETPFFAAMIAAAVLMLLRLPSAPGVRDLTGWAIALAVLPFTRPEGAIVWVVVAAIGLWRIRSLRGAAIVAGTIVPFGLFSLWMYAQTGLLVPSSVMARQVMSALQESYLGVAPTELILGRSLGVVFEGFRMADRPSTILQVIALGAGVIATARRQPPFALAFLGIGGLIGAGLVFNNPGHFLARYTSPILPLAVVTMTAGAATIAQGLARRRWTRQAWIPQAIVAGLAAVVLLPPAWVTVQAATGARLQMLDVLDADGGREVNGFADESAVVLTYEVQTAYHLRARVMSADGIVGGEILPYLRRRDVASFVRDYHVSHILSSHAFLYRGLFDHTLFEELALADDGVALGQTIAIDGLSLRKIAVHARPNNSGFWRSAYAVADIR